MKANKTMLLGFTAYLLMFVGGALSKNFDFAVFVCFPLASIVSFVAGWITGFQRASDAVDNHIEGQQ